MSSRTRAMKKAGVVDIKMWTPDKTREQQHLARRATAVPNKKRVQDRKACRGPVRAF